MIKEKIRRIKYMPGKIDETNMFPRKKDIEEAIESLI
jgi:hypothetical protein